jgi:hypothetical protein
MLRRVVIVTIDVSEELGAEIISVTRIGELGTALAVTIKAHCEGVVLLVTANVIPSSQILVTLKMEAIRSSETSVLTRTTRSNIPEAGILHSHRRESHKSYIALTA